MNGLYASSKRREEKEENSQKGKHLLVSLIKESLQARE
jgi:hypothetical protein